MKKVLSVALAALLVVFLFAACGGRTTARTGDIKRVAVITNVVGVNPFLTQVVDMMGEIHASGRFPMEYSIIECTDIPAFGENIRASVEEGFDLIISVGFQGADAIAEIADMFPDRAQYVIIDAIANSQNVKSISFRPQEASYLIGIIAASVARDMGRPRGPHGGIHAMPGQGGFESRFGFMEGVKRVIPEVTNDDFIFNFTRSFSDAPLAKELALQQAAQGMVFINAASAVADFGTFEAAMERGFFTSGQDADRTTPDNPFILSTSVKYTGAVTAMVIEEFFTTGIQPGVVRLGLAEGGNGAVHITSPGNFRNHQVLTDEIIAEARRGADDIISGRVVLFPVPLEADYMAGNWVRP